MTSLSVLSANITHCNVYLLKYTLHSYIGSDLIMPCWYYEKKELRNTPSIQDGIDYETECRYRKEGARFIIDTGTKMDLGYNTMATGVVYFHRFYMFHSFKNFPRYVSIFASDVCVCVCMCINFKLLYRLLIA